MEGQRKRSKRHRRKRNNISNKARVEAAKSFGEYSRAVEAKRKAKWHPEPKPTKYAK